MTHTSESLAVLECICSNLIILSHACSGRRHTTQEFRTEVISGTKIEFQWSSFVRDFSWKDSMREWKEETEVRQRNKECEREKGRKRFRRGDSGEKGCKDAGDRPTSIPQGRESIWFWSWPFDRCGCRLKMHTHDSRIDPVAQKVLGLIFTHVRNWDDILHRYHDLTLNHSRRHTVEFFLICCSTCLRKGHDGSRLHTSSRISYRPYGFRWHANSRAQWTNLWDLSQKNN